MGFYQRLKPGYKSLFLIITVSLLVGSCQNMAQNYFKITISDEPQPKNTLPEFIEVSSQGKLVILSNRFNENNELYQTHHFVELSQVQLDSLTELFKLVEVCNEKLAESTDTLYKLNIEQVVNDEKQHRFAWISENDSTMLKFIGFCQKIPTYSKRFAMDGAYYFNTNEVCQKK